MSHRNTLLNSSSYLCLSAAIFSVGCAQTGGHSHQQPSIAAACKDATAVPSLRCASAPTARFDQHGKLWVAWVYAGHVYVSTSTDKGASFAPPLTVNRIPEKIYTEGENRPKLAFGPKGEVYLSWTQNLPQKRFSGHIRFSRSIDGSQHFADPVTVNDHQAITSHRFDALGVNKQGDIYLAWLDKRDQLTAKKAGRPYNGAALYTALSTDGGKHFLANKKIMDNTCECCRVAMAIDTDQLPVMLWRTIYGDNIRDHALVKFTGRNQAATPVRASHDNWRIEGCPHHGPAISIAADGVYHLTWFDNAPERHGLFYAHSDDRAKTFSTPITVGDYQKAAAHADVLSLGKQVYITWKEFDGTRASLHVQQSGDGGKSWSAPQQLASTTGPSDHPFLVQDTQRIYISWHRQGEDYHLIDIASQSVRGH